MTGPGAPGVEGAGGKAEGVQPQQRGHAAYGAVSGMQGCSRVSLGGVQVDAQVALYLAAQRPQHLLLQDPQHLIIICLHPNMVTLIRWCKDLPMTGGMKHFLESAYSMPLKAGSTNLNTVHLSCLSVLAACTDLPVRELSSR